MLNAQISIPKETSNQAAEFRNNCITLSATITSVSFDSNAVIYIFRECSIK